MRVIKFRVWDGKEMHYPEVFIFNQVWESLTNWSAWSGIQTEELITNQSKSGAIMQFTGLTDKNGKEIYEGDILKCEEFHHGYGTPETHIYPVLWAVSGWDGVYPSIEGSTLEVIGNIYENEDLINN